MNTQKLIIVCGPTATGKTELGIKLAKKYNGEIISADSRQVYKGMDIGTGKDIENSLFDRKLAQSKQIKYQKSKLQVKNKKFTIGYYLVDNILVWGLDFVEPDYQFNVGEYKQIAQEIINDIWQRGKLPIVVGGTGLYIKSLLAPMDYVRIPPNKRLREILGYCDIAILREKLEKLDKNRLEKMNNSDRNNPRRLIRAIEVAVYLKNHVAFHSNDIYHHSGDKHHTLLIGLNASKKILFKRIAERIKKRLRQGMIKEIEKLLAKHYDWNLTSMSGLSYQEFKPYFEKKVSLKEVVDKWQIDEQNYLKSQLVWFKKMPVTWFDISKPGFYTEVEKLVCNFLLKP